MNIGDPVIKGDFKSFLQVTSRTQDKGTKGRSLSRGDRLLRTQLLTPARRWVFTRVRQVLYQLNHSASPLA
jgi:hypothetical protein